ncbi:Protein transport protein Sec16B, partial [Ophiophagus hannah]
TSGFGWFRWFRSKANKDEAPSEKNPVASSDSTASVSQEKITQPFLVSPMNEAKSTAHHCPPPLSSTEGSSFLKRYPEAQNSQDHSSMEATIISDAGDQTSSFRHQYNPDNVPLPTTEGTVPLFNPAQQPLALGICNRIFSNTTHIICNTNNPGYSCDCPSDQKPFPYPKTTVL